MPPSRVSPLPALHRKHLPRGSPPGELPLLGVSTPVVPGAPREGPAITPGGQNLSRGPKPSPRLLCRSGAARGTSGSWGTELAALPGPEKPRGSLPFCLLLPSSARLRYEGAAACTGAELCLRCHCLSLKSVVCSVNALYVCYPLPRILKITFLENVYSFFG